MGRMPPDEEREAEIVHDHALPSPVLSRMAGYTAPDDQTQDDERQALVANDEPAERSNDYAELGEHVASVLETATAAAAKIREDAREEAQKLAERTKEKAAEVIGTARLEADKVSAEAKQLRAEAEKETHELRQRVNEYLAEKRGEAETEASEILTRAKREAGEHTRAAQERRSALDTNVALTEERLRQLVGGLRELAGRLEELLGGQAPIPTADATDTAHSPSFEAALRPSVAAEQSTEQLT
jgi:F0F1-type ATP synthase membrane subunit b/b'